MKSHTKLLGDFSFKGETFPQIKEVLSRFHEPDFQKLSTRKKFRVINETLVNLVKEAPKESFLLPAIVNFIGSVNHLKILNDHYHFSLFEFWLNHYSACTSEENYLLRAKIVGKHLPRDDYQTFFPIGMGKVHPGTHFVVSHLSPDIDTMMASFWGWVDAFAARVGDGVHIWSLPGGPPHSPVSQIFKEMLGEDVFTTLARTSHTQTLCAMDLVTQKNLVKEQSGTSISTLDHGFNEKAVILIDESGHYCGDWRSHDVEPVRQIIVLFKSCLRWFETNLYSKLITFFGKYELSVEDIPEMLEEIFEIKIKDIEPVKEFGEKQKQDLESFLTKVLGVEKGLQATFNELNSALEKLSITELTAFHKELAELPSNELFDERGLLIENRSRIFNTFQKLFKILDKAIHRIRDYVEGLEVASKIKSLVLGKQIHYLTPRSDVEDIKVKMSNYSYLTVVVPEDNGKLYPLGIVWASDIRKAVLGTVSFRDFSNFDEVKMASYLSVISIIDHHKSSMKTNTPSLTIIGDAQSCNVLIAEETSKINKKYSIGRLTEKDIAKHLIELNSKPTKPDKIRIAQKLLQKKMALETKGSYYVHPLREMMECLCFLHAILDDTDLLTKVSYRDVECVAQLLNTMKSIASKEEIEIISLDDIPKDKHFANKAAKRILQQPDMYSLYKRIYSFKEHEVDKSLRDCVEGSNFHIFSDTKEQNACCRVGQTKLFTSNIPLYIQLKLPIIQRWLKMSEGVFKAHREIDLHLHMISTISSAEEVYNDQMAGYSHQDELWIWIPHTEQGQNHLASFLNTFQSAPEIIKNELTVEIPLENAEIYKEIFLRNFRPIEISYNADLPLAILKYKAGSLNSRKASISPYLPRLVH